MSQKNLPMGVPFNLVEHIDYAADAVISKTLIDKGIGTVTLFSFDKGQGLSEHTSPYDAVVYIVDGEAEITIDGKSQTVKNGEMIIMPSQIPHSLRANVRYKMLLTMIRKKEQIPETT